MVLLVHGAAGWWSGCTGNFGANVRLRCGGEQLASWDIWCGVGLAWPGVEGMGSLYSFQYHVLSIMLIYMKHFTTSHYRPKTTDSRMRAQ
jgi:hypothetical protein